VPIEKLRVIEGPGLPLPGDNIDTDRIIPARYLRAVSFEGLEEHLFADDREQAKAQGVIHPCANPRYDGAAILLVNANFGCGSSREHAPQAIRRRGIRAVAGESFSEIFFGNSVALGMPCVSVNPDAARTLQQMATDDPTLVMTIDLFKQTIVAGDRSFSATLPAAARDSFLDGSWDATGLLLDRFEEVEAVVAKLPYTRRFA
jgi:3-isopropylmalate/(R)-2-methylmalate dehydratase small subunit